MSYKANTPAITKKQVGIVYREIMRGNLVINGKFKPGRIYDFAGFHYWTGHTDVREQNENYLAKTLLRCVDAIFAGDMKNAQGELGEFFETIRLMRKAS